MLLTSAAAYTERRPDMTELFNPRPVHDGRGSGSSNEGRVSLITRCSVFKDHSAGSTGLAASRPSLGPQKGPLDPGARNDTAAWRPIWAPRYEAALFVIRSKSDRGV